MAHDQVYDGQVDAFLGKTSEFYKWLQERATCNAAADRILRRENFPSLKWPGKHSRLRFFRVDLRRI